MNPLRILHLEDNAEDVTLVQRQLGENGLDAEILVVKTGSEYLAAIERRNFNLILSDSQISGFSGYSAFEIARDRCPEVPFIFVYRQIDEAQAVACLRNGAVDCIAKDQLWRLEPVIQRVLKDSQRQRSPARQQHWIRGMERLVTVVQELSIARNLETIAAIVRRAARELTGADGATFILREGDQSYYLEEDAITPLWKGRRFPIDACIGGLSMQNRQPVIIEDVDGDSRIPIEAYRPTFIKSLVVVPIRQDAPIGAIGNYWAKRHVATPEEVQLLQALADTTSVAMENVQVYTELEQRVRERTAQLEEVNQELEAFSYTLTHDLRRPLTTINVIIGLLRMKYASQLGEQGETYLGQLHAAVGRIDQLIDEILTLHRVTQAEIEPEVVDLSSIAREIVAEMQAADPNRQVETVISDGLIAYADLILMRAMLENLLFNAWKYTSKRSQAYIEFNSLSQSDGLQVFYVRDNGAGFDMSKAEKLFAPFQRLHSDAEFPGTGVGLASVQRIVQKHGGRIWVEAAIEQGATFYFSLPGISSR